MTMQISSESISAAGTVTWGLRASPAMSIACRKPMKARIIPPPETAAKTPCRPSGANPAEVKLSTSNRAPIRATPMTMGIASLNQVISPFACASALTPNAFTTTKKTRKPTVTSMPSGESGASLPSPAKSQGKSGRAYFSMTMVSMGAWVL